MSMFGADFATGEFMPRYPGKCLNKNGKMPGVHSKITFRSSWESIFANWCDIEDNVIEWGSECIEIPYFSQIDNRKHKYVTDFIVLTRNKNTGKIEKWLVEVKPACQVPQLNECGAIIFPELNKKRFIAPYGRSRMNCAAAWMAGTLRIMSWVLCSIGISVKTLLPISIRENMNPAICPLIMQR